MQVRPVSKATAEAVVKNKHYTKRLGIFWEGFGLFSANELVGVVCYGQPSAPIQKYAFKDRDFRLYELTRLVVDRGISNGASFLIANSLKMLKEGYSAVISYADGAQGHSGIVYQATNWMYTGAVKAHDCLYMVDGEKLHPMTLRDRFGVTEPSKWAKENGYEKVLPEAKHRYFYFNGNKYQKRSMIERLTYAEVSEYPKSQKQCYNDGQPCKVYIK